MSPRELRAGALAALRVADPSAKVCAVRELVVSAPPPDPARDLAAPADIPGRPARPALVRPAELARRPAGTSEGRAALLHAVAHIEFNANDH